MKDREPATAPELPKPALVVPFGCVQGPAEPLPVPSLPPSPGDMPVIPKEAPTPTVAGLSARLSIVQQALAVTQWRLSALEVRVPSIRAQASANEARLAECKTGLEAQKVLPQ